MVPCRRCIWKINNNQMIYRRVTRRLEVKGEPKRKNLLQNAGDQRALSAPDVPADAEQVSLQETKQIRGNPSLEESGDLTFGSVKEMFLRVGGASIPV